MVGYTSTNFLLNLNSTPNLDFAKVVYEYAVNRDLTFFLIGYTWLNRHMPLSIGEKLGPYEITAPIGKGGMGEVYRARDTRLNREVAIKISAERFTNVLNTKPAPSPR